MLKEERARWLILAGGLGLAAAPFLVWVRVTLLGDLTLFSLTTAAGESNALPWAAVAVGLTIAAAALLAPRALYVRIVAIVLGVIAALYAGALLVGLARAVDQAYGFAALGLGPLIAAASTLAIVAGGLTVNDVPRPGLAPTPTPPRYERPVESTPAAVIEPAPPPHPRARAKVAAHSTPRVVRLRTVAFVAALLVALAAAIVATYMLGRGDSQATLRRFCHNQYCIGIPAGWRYQYAGYFTEQTTFFYWNPDNALEQLTIIKSDCVVCVTKDFDLATPDITVPNYATDGRRISPYELRFQTFEGRSPYPTDWRVYLPHDEDGVKSSYNLRVDLPETKRALADEILDSFTLGD